MHKILSLNLFHFGPEKTSTPQRDSSLVILAGKNLLRFFFTTFSVAGFESIIFSNIIHKSKLENLNKISGFKGC